MLKTAISETGGWYIMMNICADFQKLLLVLSLWGLFVLLLPSMLVDQSQVILPGHVKSRREWHQQTARILKSAMLFIQDFHVQWGNSTHRRLCLPQRHNAPPVTEPQRNSTYYSFRVLSFTDWFGVQIIGCTFKHILHSTFRVFKLRDWFGLSCF